MTQNDHSDVYIIPPNFVRDGTLFSGRAEARNVVEAAFLALVGIRFLVFLNLGIKGKIYVGIILILPLVILAVIGVQGESLSSFLIQLFSYMVKRRVLTAPSGQYRLKRNRRIRKQQKKRCDENVKREKRRVAEIGSEVEELKRKLKEARKSEKLEKREKRQQEYEKKKSARLQKRQDVQEEKLRKKEDRLQAAKRKTGSCRRFHEQEAKNAASGKIWLCRQRKKL